MGRVGSWLYMYMCRIRIYMTLGVRGGGGLKPRSFCICMTSPDIKIELFRNKYIIYVQIKFWTASI